MQHEICSAAQGTFVFILKVPSENRNELSWIATVVLREHLGLDFSIEEVQSGDYVLEYLDRKLVLRNDFLSKGPADRKLAAAMPSESLEQWNPGDTGLSARLVKQTIPVLFGRASFSVDSDGNGKLDLDVFGSAFFMLSRYEETIVPDRDEHDRFPATASVAFMEGFLDRPIIDEYVEILWAAISRVWPVAQRKKWEFKMSVSHDIDSPSYFAFRAWKQLLRRAAGDLLKRGRMREAAHDMKMWMLSRQSIHPSDPYNTFGWIMDNSERLGLSSTFYVICGRNHPRFDPDYDVDHPAIRRLLRDISDRQHKIGLHASYNAYKSAETIAVEAERLRKVCAEEGISIAELPGRMHYLRWHTPITLYLLQRAGIAVDSTLAFADHAGFRCGTCHEYQAFDPVESKQLDIRIQPLVAMEGSVMDERYMGLGISDAAADALLALKNACRTVDGTFSLLWHNTQLVRDDQRSLYTSVLAG